MTETSFASLSPTLLARKGGAKPAMRRQIAPLHGDSNGAGNDAGAALSADLEDLGWNDMGEAREELPQPTGGLAGLTPEPVSPQPQAAAVTDISAPSQISSDVFDAPSPAKQQIDELAARIAADDTVAAADLAPAPAPAATPARPVKARRSALSRGKRAAFTLRLDADRHLKLRLASTVRGRSAQALVTDALDRLLDEMPEINSMAAQVAGK